MKFLVIYSESAGLNLPIMYYIPYIKLPPIVSTMKTLLLVPCADCRILKSNFCHDHHHCTFLMWCDLSQISVISFSAVSPPTEKSVPVSEHIKVVLDTAKRECLKKQGSRSARLSLESMTYYH